MDPQNPTYLKISTPLSADATYLEVADSSQSLKSVLVTYADELEETGFPQESQQMRNLMSDHSAYIKGAVVQYDAPVAALSFDLKTVDDAVINFAEISLLKQHVGGH
jgi:hypothetical protein